MGFILSLVVAVSSVSGFNPPKRIPVGVPALQSGTEDTVTVRVGPGGVHSTESVQLGVDDDNRRLIRYGNDRGNLEKRLTRGTEGSHVLIHTIERFAGKGNWLDAGRRVTVYVGSRWTFNVNVEDGSASVWLTYFPEEGVSAAIGCDAVCGFLLRMQRWDLGR